MLSMIGNRSVPIALGVSGLLRLPALLLYARAIRRGSAGTSRPPEARPLSSRPNHERFELTGRRRGSELGSLHVGVDRRACSAACGKRLSFEGCRDGIRLPRSEKSDSRGISSPSLL